MSDYTEKINQLTNSINNNCREVKKISVEIENLSESKEKLKKLLAVLESSSFRGKKRINSIPNLFRHTVKLNLFSGILDAITGVQYKNAVSDVNTCINKITDKISELKKRIEILNRQNSSYQSEIINVKKTREEK